MKSFFITFEGPEGSGKTTQINFLTEYLQEKGLEIFQTREPGGTLIGDKIRKILLDQENIEMDPVTEIFLYEAVRVEHVKKKIVPALKSNKVVISDRYYDSTLAYQGFARGLPPEQVETCNHFAVGDVHPQLTILLDVTTDVSAERVEKRGYIDRIESEGKSFHEKVRNGFLKIAENEPDRFIVIDGTKSIEDIREVIRKEVTRRFNID
ncbi:dTMP kinase [bacterium]|nr:dTMP kinase [bacterium]